MTDREFLIWIHERLELVHGDTALNDFMHRLRKIIRSTLPFKDSSRLDSCNSLIELKREIGK